MTDRIEWCEGGWGGFAYEIDKSICALDLFFLFHKFLVIEKYIDREKAIL